jgi:hypothetical protein
MNDEHWTIYHANLINVLQKGEERYQLYLAIIALGKEKTPIYLVNVEPKCPFDWI